ncbi:vasopressin V2 receptor-like isoform X2 [Gouania willdenowi]|uniref:vasopressin V2 receptor-like isoform X2 n=1 Tax=Gouania willdenowi TaxID=441366 RepID=UPI00105532E6|nr:vasopressin V2 receptor-like isoform X2 [Gouania willdenowi]
MSSVIQSESSNPQRDVVLATAKVLLLAVVLVTTLLGNGLVLAVLLRRKRCHSNPLHQFMINLCVADLVVALFQVLPQLVWDAEGLLPGPDCVCRMVKYLQVVGMFASSYMIVAMTMDRHYAICCPLQAHRSLTTRRRKYFILMAWSLSLVLSLPQVFIFSRSEVSPGVYECWGTFEKFWGLRAYVTWMTLVIFILPVLIIIVCQVRIFREIHSNLCLRSERRMSPSGPDVLRTSGGKSVLSVEAHVSTHTAELTEPPVAPPAEVSASPTAPPAATAPSAAMSKTVRMTLVIVLFYSVCWAPFFIVQLWAAWDPHPPVNGAAFTLLMLLASLNSITNPWIYSSFSSSVSLELRLLLLCSRPLQRHSSITSSTHTSIY